MLLSLTLVAPDLDILEEVLPAALEAVAGAGYLVKDMQVLGPGALDLLVDGDDPVILRARAELAMERYPVDICAQLAEGRRKRLLIADMDSTIIGVECLDELADFAGLKSKIAPITERAMRGELEFEPALRERVAMLEGLPLSVLHEAYEERVKLNPGAECLVRTMAQYGARCVLVSGGFDYFTSRVAEAAGFQAERANRLLDDGSALIGAVAEPILGREAKLAALKEEAAAAGVELYEAVAVGDGANDLAMIIAAGLGVAYRAKPIVAGQADARVDHSDLTALLYFQGYGADEFVN
ncbi:MAG TPA: phosphoserine phosphatase SerB [Caulobacteraceae bacterium]|nr:phosphoserine phosphatase SerB [Caulobacteraceae bacterium]